MQNYFFYEVETSFQRGIRGKDSWLSFLCILPGKSKVRVKFCSYTLGFVVQC